MLSKLHSVIRERVKRFIFEFYYNSSELRKRKKDYYKIYATGKKLVFVCIPQLNPEGNILLSLFELPPEVEQTLLYTQESPYILSSIKLVYPFWRYLNKRGNMHAQTNLLHFCLFLLLIGFLGHHISRSWEVVYLFIICRLPSFPLCLMWTI